MQEKVTSVKWVTESALMERINERLADDSRQLQDLRMDSSPSLGHFYEQPNSIDGHSGSIDLEAVGREMGVLAPDEAIAHISARRSGVDLDKSR
jgi:hypothetical protein